MWATMLASNLFKLNKTKMDIIVIGGGAAGMMAAGAAGANGASVLLIEKMNRTGIKLSITGKGRCNLTNDIPVNEFLTHVGSEPRFLKSAFSKFYNRDLISFFDKMGVKTVVERGGRIFPESQNSQDVVEAMRKWCSDNRVEVECAKCVGLNVDNDGKINGVTLDNGPTINSKCVIIATGGASFVGTGSTGDGYKFAKSVGHTVVLPRPVLVSLETEGSMAKEMQGLSLKNANVTAFVDNKKRMEMFGEMLFTHQGVSGPIILTLSRHLIDDILAKREVYISIDLKPAVEDKTLDNRLIKDLAEHGKMKFQNLLSDYLPSSMISVILKASDVDGDKWCNQISGDERKRIKNNLKGLKLRVIGSGSWNEAIVTAGGVSLNEIDQRTMESKLIKGLYFAGEVMDLDADTGGYNLQIAFSTGWVAGISAAESLNG